MRLVEPQIGQYFAREESSSTSLQLAHRNCVILEHQSLRSRKCVEGRTVQGVETVYRRHQCGQIAYASRVWMWKWPALAFLLFGFGKTK